MLICSKKVQSRVDKLRIENVILDKIIGPYCSEVKNLGVIINNNLNWDSHVNKVTKLVYSRIGSLRIVGKFLPVSIKKIAIESLVFSHFDYCDVVYNDLNLELVKRLQRTQNACIRLFTI